MASRVGSATGLKDTSLKGVPVVILDCLEAFERVKKEAMLVAAEYRGLPGVEVAKVEVGDGRLPSVVVALTPPYPPVIFEVVNELILFGARRVVVVSRGYRVKRSSPPPRVSVVASSMAIGLDSVSPRLAPERLPLTAAAPLLAAVERARGAFQIFPGYTVTVDSARLVAGDPTVQDYIKARQVVAVDTVSAPLYALSYIYPAFEALSLVVIDRAWSQAAEPLEEVKRGGHEPGLASIESSLVRVVLAALAEGGEA